MGTYFIGGSPCAGKSTAAEWLAKKYGLHYFKPDDNLEKYIRLGARQGFSICKKQAELSAEQNWMRDPRLQFEEELVFYREILPFILEDLRQLDTGRDIITEGACYLPVLAKELGIPAQRYLSLTPEREFQITHYRERQFVPMVLEGCSDREQAFHNWMERDALFAAEVRRQCEEYGYRSLVNDGSLPAGEMAKSMAIHFGLQAQQGEEFMMPVNGYYAVDRFEGEYAVCEGPDGKMRAFARVELPRGAREGDVLCYGGGGWEIDRRETTRRREKARALFESLLE